MKLTRLVAMVTAAAISFASIPAFAQGPQASFLTAPIQYNTYRATKVSLSPASSATDFFTITGATGKVVRVRRLACSGISTANAVALIQVVKRSTANTSGTAASATAVPLNSARGVAASATVRSYTANPTVGTAVGTIASGELATGPAASATIDNATLVFDFTNQNVILNAATEVLALNANGASFTSGASISCGVEWSE